MTLPVIDRLSRLFVQEGKERTLVADYIKQLRVKTASPQGRPHTFGRQRAKSRFGKMAGD
jgi:hypothetical protein